MNKEHNHYYKPCPYDTLDVYRVINIFGVSDPCIQHALKKLLCSGVRGHKDQSKDIQDVIDTLERWKEMRNEDNKITSPKVPPVTCKLTEKSYKLWCETCEGVGSYDNRDFGVPKEYYNANCPCPDCDGKGYLNEVVNVSEKQIPKDSSVNADIDSPAERWYPDNSGEWIEYDGSGQPVEDDVEVEALFSHERERKYYDPCQEDAEDWCWKWSEVVAADIVAYKVVKEGD